MSSPNLASILSSLPETNQCKAIITYLHELLTSGKWGEADAIGEKVSAITDHPALKAEAASICLLIFLRRQNLPAALDRYHYIYGLGMSFEVLCHQANALFHLAGYLLPDQPSKLSGLWQQMSKLELPPHAQRLSAQIGVMLLKQFLKNSDKTNAVSILHQLQASFDMTVCQAAVTEAQEIFKQAL